MSVPLPAPDGPEMTNSRAGEPRAPVSGPEQRDELVALALGEAADRLRLADPALVQAARRLDAAELRHRQQHVEDLRRQRYSGGRVSTSRAETSPAFKSRFSCARSTRTAFARRSASMRWSSDRAVLESGASGRSSLSADRRHPMRCGASGNWRRKPAREREKREPLVECCCFQCPRRAGQAALSESGRRVRRGRAGRAAARGTRAVPTCTALAPAARNSSASRRSRSRPPRRSAGRTAARQACTAASATGLSAGPERPPVTPPSSGSQRPAVDREPAQRVREHQRVGAAALGGARDRGDVGDVRRELDPQRQRGRGAAGARRRPRSRPGRCRSRCSRS